RKGGQRELSHGRPRNRTADQPAIIHAVPLSAPDHADHLVPRDGRAGDPGPTVFLRDRVAVTDAAGLDLDPHPARPRVRDRPLDELEAAAAWSYSFSRTALSRPLIRE